MSILTIHIRKEIFCRNI